MIAGYIGTGPSFAKCDACLCRGVRQSDRARSRSSCRRCQRPTHPSRGRYLMTSPGTNASTQASDGDTRATALELLGPVARYEHSVLARIQDFQDPRQEWRRLFSEFLGTFMLVTVAAGGGMMSQAFPDTISRASAVVAPGLMVLGVILFMGKISGAHLNPAVSIAFALRRDFPWWRVPGYIVAQLAGATVASLMLVAIIDVSAKYGSNYPAADYSSGAAFWMELLLTFGLVSVILGTASGAQNVGIVGAFGVGSYIALAGLWGSPISGTSMNPARTFGPDLASLTFTDYWVYVAGPVAGAVVAVGVAFVLRGPGGGMAGSGAAQGDLFLEAQEPTKA
ncbi:MAG TPA: MIP/aquaporin family protein [Acidimicrobiales bacterium]|nr:MIP/aquaporin family protein [Acidimicrobiales bacterium]